MHKNTTCQFVLKALLLAFLCTMLTSCTRILSNEELDARRGGLGQKYTAVFMNGQKCGFDRQSRTVLDDRVTTRNVSNYTIDFLSTKRQFSNGSICVESLNGEILEFEGDYVKGVLNADGRFDITDLKNGKKIKEIAISQGTLFEEGYLKLKREKGLQEGTVYKVPIFDIESLEPTEISVKVGKKKKVQLINATEELTELFMIYDKPRGRYEGVEYLDDDCNIKMSVYSIGSLRLKSVACEREFALSEHDAADIAGLIGFIKSPERLKGYRKANSIGYYLKPKSVEKLELYQGDCQHLKRKDDGDVLLTVKALEIPEGIIFPYQGTDFKALKALKPTELIQSDDELIAKLAKKAIGDVTDTASAVKKIEKYVFKYIRNKKEDYSIGTLTALDVAKDKRGDCKAHALLMAAVCRSSGIPARIMSGYRYTYIFGRGNGFAAHAWNEVYVDDKWISCDSTRYSLSGSSRSYDASYIAISSSLGLKKESTIDRLGTFEIIDVHVYR